MAQSSVPSINLKLSTLLVSHTIQVHLHVSNSRMRHLNTSYFSSLLISFITKLSLTRLWPASISSSPKGTVDWAGGMINWNDPDYQSAGHFYARINSISVKCANSSNMPANSNITSYVYGGNNASSSSSSNHNIPTILFSNRTTLLNGGLAGRLAVPLQGGIGGMVVMLGLGFVLGFNALLL